MDLENVKVLIVPDNVDGNELKVFKFRYPEPASTTDKQYRTYLTIAIKKDFSEIYELVKWSSDQHSYLIDDGSGGPTAVKSDADAFIVTKIDPIFLLVPYLATLPQISGVERPAFSLADLLDSSDLSAIHDVVRHAQHTCLDLQSICDRDPTDDSQFFFSESKTLVLLKSKVDRLVQHLETKHADSDSCKWYAFDIVAGYLNSSFREKLMSFCGLGPVHALQKRKLSQLNDVTDNGHSPVANKRSKVSAKGGSKPPIRNNTLITSFFKKATN